MNIRETIVKERQAILEKMDNVTLLRNINKYFSENMTMSGEKALKDSAEKWLKFNPNEELPEDTRKQFIEKFAEVCIKQTRLDFCRPSEAVDVAMMDKYKVDRSDEDLRSGQTHYLLTGKVTTASKPQIKAAPRLATVVSFDDKHIPAEIISNTEVPSKFVEAHRSVIGKQVTVEVIDYSNGHGKNMTFDMYVDMMRGNDSGKTLVSDRYASNGEYENFTDAIESLKTDGESFEL